ncbi:uncharacterized protein LOC124131345 [Haliotis rufescens]|uniref:uncharacterized protein LOC124131345 n=1 Tax=Haliotis rufescens TaxID=6454 RepID=UPI00201F6073|nr:uncharacterized protein LOC124131345 [Haliotis rufescens]
MHGQSSTCTGIEHKVQQRSLEWFSLRRNTLITASQFGDVIGVGRGKPFDFFLSLISEDSIFELDDNLMSHLQHGIDTEIIIKEAYEMLTGNSVRDSGFWVPNKDSPLKTLIGASPDGVVVDRDCPENIIGLTEFKAPVHKMYSGNDLDYGIPRQYMAQIQGQMAVVGAPWCDFLAVCTKTREIMLKRVHFHPLYWLHVSDVIRQFCHTLQESQVRETFGQDPLESLSAKKLRTIPMHRPKFPGEDSITVVDLLEQKDGMFRGPSKVFMSFDLLMGYPCNQGNSSLNIDHVLERIDSQIHNPPPSRVV